MRITSYGAARGVTGSKHLLEISDRKILLDCGMFQGHRVEAAEKNKHLPFSVQDLHAVVLSHAHIDHSGILPVLGRHAYPGRVYATPATRDLCDIMLLDSAHIQDRDAKWLSKKHQTFVPPIYADEDVYEIMRHFVSFPYDMPFEAAPGVQVTFKDAGHVLGSAMVKIDFEEDGRTRTFIFSGDIGRKGVPILKNPWEPSDADVVMMESTYGNRDHKSIESLEDELDRVIHESVERKGKIIVPTFALERAQEFVFALKQLEASNRIPTLPVFVDSPLTVNITEVFRLHTDLFDRHIRKVIEESGDPFRLKKIKYIRAVEDSMALNTMEGPAIIIAASGMCEFGRVVHHLKNNIEGDRNTVLIIGFQATNTLGRRLVDGERDVRILGMKHRVRARIEVLDGFSAHAGRQELIDFGARFAGRAERILLVHGEEEALESLQGDLRERGCNNVTIQDEGVAVEV